MDEQTKYRHKENGRFCEQTIEETWRRVARAIAAVEPHDREEWQDKFYEILKGYKFLPGGRILAGPAPRVAWRCSIVSLWELSRTRFRASWAH